MIITNTKNKVALTFNRCLFFVFFLSVLDIIRTQTLSDEMRLMTNRTDLKCPDGCPDLSCCVCFTEPTYVGMLELTVVYSNTYTNAMLFAQDTTRDIFFINHSNGSLNQMPDNICFFKGIVFIDFSFNYIEDIDVISCVESLDTLIMKGNKISYLRNTTFLSMKFIRYIDLSYNVLSYMEPGFLFNMAGSLFYFNVSHNLLKTVDVTNIIWTKQKKFCKADFSYNIVSEIINELDWKCSEDSQLGRGGFVYLSNNAFTHFFNFSRLGFDDIRMFGKLIPYGFDVRGNKWICDCGIYSYLKLAGPMLPFVEYQESFKVRCHSPPEYKDMLITDFYKTLDRLICNISIADKCPPKCQCFYQPATNKTVVNCSDSTLTALPSALPKAVLDSQLEVDFSRNHLLNIDSLTDILHSTFTEKITLFNLSSNNIKILPDKLPYILQNVTTVDFTGNDIGKIPRSVQSLHPCHVLFDKFVINCKCDDKWLQTWISGTRKMCDVQIFCTEKNSLFHISNMTEEQFGCSPEPASLLWLTYVLVVLTLTVAVVFTFIFTFRFEFLILCRKAKKYFRKPKIDSSVYDFDVYISCNEEDQTLRAWLTSFFVPYIENKHLNVFLPFRDGQIGRPREEEINDIMARTQNFVIFISDEYIGSLKTWVQIEWKCAWHNYKSDLNREIVVVNYDMLSCKDTRKKYLGAFLRLGYFIDFANHNQLFTEEIFSALQKSDQNIQPNDSNISVSNMYLLSALQNDFQQGSFDTTLETSTITSAL